MKISEPAAACNGVSLRVSHVFGSAHGIGLYTNTLDFDAVMAEYDGIPPGDRQNDPAERLVALVEEGKHATAVDRNGDGFFTPGFDVNVNGSDAWGVRDAVRSNVLVPQFRADMFKPRERDLSVSVPKARQDAAIAPEGTATKSGRRYILDNSKLVRTTAETLVCGEPGSTEDQRHTSLKAFGRQLAGAQRTKFSTRASRVR